MSAFDKFNSLLTRTKSGAKKTVEAKKLVAEFEKEGR